MLNRWKSDDKEVEKVLIGQLKDYEKRMKNENEKQIVDQMGLEYLRWKEKEGGYDEMMELNKQYMEKGYMEQVVLISNRCWMDRCELIKQNMELEN